MQEGGELQQSLKQPKNNQLSPNSQDNFDRLITTLSTNFIILEPDYLDLEINKSLQMIGEFAQVDRSYVFLYSEDGNYMTNTHEWCAPGIEPQITQIQNFPVDRLPWLQEIINKFEIIHVPKVDELPPEAHAEQEVFQSQSIQSLVVVPIEYSQKLIGFVGFDSVCRQKNWEEEDITLLQIFGSIIGRAIIQVKNKKELIMRERFFQKLNEISFSFLNAKDTQEMLDIVVNQLKYVIMADGCFIALWDEHKNQVIPAAASEPFSQAYKDLQLLPEENTVTQYVIDTNDFVIVEDVEKSQFLSPRIANLFASHCLLGIPLMAEHHKLGALLFGFSQTHHFSQEEISLAHQAANLVSMALSKQLALQEATKHAQEVGILRNSAMIVASTLEPDLAISRILEQLEQVVPFDYASVQLLVDRYLEVRAVNGQRIPENMIGKRFYIPGDNPNTAVIQTQKPLSLANAQEDFLPFRQPKFTHIHSWLGVPLIVHDQIIGMIALEHSDINFYNAEHVKLASAFADQVSISLYNAQLYQEEQHRAKELDALRDTLFEITNELDLSQLLPAIVRRAVSLLNAEAGELALYNSEKAELKVVVSQSVGKDIS